MISTLYNNFFSIVSTLSILYVSTYLFSYIQTVRNIISFAALVLFLSFGVGVSFGIQYYPMFLMLTYVGAIIVATLFVVLTFDIRKEYKQKKKYIDDIFYVIGLSEAINAFICFCWILLERESVHSSFVGRRFVDPETIERVHERCVLKHGEIFSICDKSFLRHADASLYSHVKTYTNDLHVVSSNLYTNYSFLFICLAILLSISLMAALTILKQK